MDIEADGLHATYLSSAPSDLSHLIATPHFVGGRGEPRWARWPGRVEA